MGTMNSHAIVVTCWDQTLLTAAQRAANECCPGLASSVVEWRINGGGSFMIGPDGSKEGWPESERGDLERAAFIAWLNQHRYEDGSTSLHWVLIEFGEDAEAASVIDSFHCRHRQDQVPA